MILKYESERYKIKTWDVFFTKSKSIYWKLIRFFTKSKINHVWLFVWLEDRLFIVESSSRWIEAPIPFSLYFEKNKNIYYWKIKHELPEEEIKRRIFSKWHEKIPEIWTKYDWIWALLSIFYDTWSRNSFCSEYVAKILWIVFYSIRWWITPEDISKKCILFKKII